MVKLGILNVGPNHISRIDNGEEPTILDEGFPDVQLFTVHIGEEQFLDIIQFLATGLALEGYMTQ